MQHQHVRSCERYVEFRFGLVTCSATSTLYSAAVALPARVRLARRCGLATDDQNLQLAAGLHADIPTLLALSELGMPLSDIVVRAAALSGRLNILQHLLTNLQCPKLSTLSYYAASSGSVSMLKWLKTMSWCRFDSHTCAKAASAGHLAALRHLCSEGCGCNSCFIGHYAASGGSIEMVEWLRLQHGIVFDAAALSWAAGAGKTAMCAHLRSTGCDWDAWACHLAARNKHPDTLRWLRGHGCPFDVGEVCNEAARGNRTDVFDLVKEQGEVLSAELLTDTLNCAGAHNQLRAAQWLRQNGAEWSAVLGYEEEVEEGEPFETTHWSGESLAWARAEGCTSPVSL
jgi:hypothetical protein